MVLQAVTGGGFVALAVTFVFLTALYALTLHLAATFFIGEVPSQRAAYAAVAPAATSLLLQRYGIEGHGVLAFGIGVAVVIVATLVADAVAIRFVYGLKAASTVALTLLHFAFFAVLGIALNNIFGLV